MNKVCITKIEEKLFEYSSFSYHNVENIACTDELIKISDLFNFLDKLLTFFLL